MYEYVLLVVPFSYCVHAPNVSFGSTSVSFSFVDFLIVALFVSPRFEICHM